ncbi:antA/AntB antirepressor family protein, partial [Ursidibacter arcticus]
MTTFQITTFTGSLQNQPTQLINARELHERLQITTKFQDWIKRRISDYNFIENEDYTCFSNLRSSENKGFSGFWGGQNKIDYHITLDMAKELCMLERSELGRKARRHF